MNKLGIVHPKLMTSLQAGLHPSTCKVEEPTETLDTYGQPIASWSTLSGHSALSCRIAPQTNSGAREINLPNQTYARHVYTIWIPGYYPSITEKMRAVVGGKTYGIELVEHDGNQTQTRLTVELVR